MELALPARRTFLHPEYCRCTKAFTPNSIDLFTGMASSSTWAFYGARLQSDKPNSARRMVSWSGPSPELPYSEGFLGPVEFVADEYIRPARGETALDLLDGGGNAFISFGEISDAISPSSFRLTIDERNRNNYRDPETGDRLYISFNASKGFFKIRVTSRTIEGKNTWLHGGGVILQKQNRAVGHYTGRTRVGRRIVSLSNFAMIEPTDNVEAEFLSPRVAQSDGGAFSYAVTVANAFDVGVTNLPDGLEWDPETRTINGRFFEAGVHYFTLWATNSEGRITRQIIRVNVDGFFL